MNTSRLAAIVLIVAGALGLIYGGFSYTRESHRADIGPLHLEVNEKQHVNIPLWLGIAALVGGVVLLGSSRRS